jgi:hypothetical protein
LLRRGFFFLLYFIHLPLAALQIELLYVAVPTLFVFFARPRPLTVLLF